MPCVGRRGGSISARNLPIGISLIASRFKPRLAPLAGEPFLSLCFAVKADNVLLLPAKGMRRHEAPATPSLIGFGSKVTLSAGFTIPNNMRRFSH